MLDATCDCETCTEVATPVHRRTPRGSWPLSPAVVLLVGATDAIRGTRTEDVVQVIRDSMALYAERLVICSVPEVTTREKVTLARAITLNAQLKKMCSILRATFLDNSKQLEEGWLVRDSALYVADIATQVATRLATIANNFLGNRKGPRRRDKRGPKRKKENDTGTTGHGRPGGLTPTALDVCGQGSEGHPAQPQAQHPVLLRHPQPGTTKHPQEPTDPQKTEHWASVPCGATIPGDAIKRRDTTSCPAPAVPALAGQHTASIPNPTDGSTTYWTRPGSHDSRHGPALHEATTSPMTCPPCRAGHGQESFHSGEYGRHCGPEDIRKCRSKCHRCRAKWQCFRLGFLNMHGARREQKWGELYNVLRDEEFSLYAMGETNLRDLEEPPIQPD
ncbi:hypothetical protein HPB51_010277 [Rhipicephalus microplus]|uniref:Uncharacterized protein n=1 Tax=Rhipicephalus microplus TaxID=6941 RepID=A0A9J6D5H9_RHIMP|nr:hypothetical protein HPB51_010277 [Rhipicephalus microplus]